jgi:hypothetical protein
VTFSNRQQWHLLTIHQTSDFSLFFDHLLLSTRRVGYTVQLIKRLKLCFPLEEDVSLDPPRQPRTDLVRHMTPCRDAKYVVKLLQGTFPEQRLALIILKERHNDKAYIVSGTMKKMTTNASMLSPA